MTRNKNKSFASRSTFGQPETDREIGKASESVERQSIERLNWANCREPYKSELDLLSSYWIEGFLSDEHLAYRAVQILSELDWVNQPDKASQKIPVDDVVSQLKILTEAMLTCSVAPDCTPDSRKQALDFMRTEFADIEIQSHSAP